MRRVARVVAVRDREQVAAHHATRDEVPRLRHHRRRRLAAPAREPGRRCARKATGGHDGQHRDEGEQDRATQTHGDDCPTPIAPIQPLRCRDASCVAGRDRHVPVHRHRGLHPSVGRGPERHGRRAARARRDRARRDRASRRLRLRHRRRRLRRRLLDRRRRGVAPRSRRRRSSATTPPSTSRVRMGLHTGEAIERDRNYFGSEVNRAARLMSIAHGGQVLVSDATEVLVRDRVGAPPARRAPPPWAAGPDVGVPGGRRRPPGRLPRAAQRRRAGPATSRSS